MRRSVRQRYDTTHNLTYTIVVTHICLYCTESRHSSPAVVLRELCIQSLGSVIVLVEVNGNRAAKSREKAAGGGTNPTCPSGDKCNMAP